VEAEAEPNEPEAPEEVPVEGEEASEEGNDWVPGNRES
jgi:hypothetical protein